MSTQPKPIEDILQVIVQNREGYLFKDKAKAVISMNEKGIFSILPRHTNFVSIVKDFIRIQKLDGTSFDVRINYGIIKATLNTVYVYLGLQIRTTDQAVKKQPPSTHSPAPSQK